MVEALPPQLQENRVLSLSIIYLGGILGIVMMRLVAGFFLVLLNKYKGLAAGAYLLVGWIGLKLIGGGLHSAFHSADYQLWHEFLPAFTGGLEEIAAGATPYRDWRDLLPGWVREFSWEMPDWFFWVGMATIIAGSLLYKPRSDRQHVHPAPPPGQDPAETAVV
jgi:hypothetical protein